MNFPAYLKKLLIVSVPLALMVIFSMQAEAFAKYQLFIWGSLAFFFVLSCGVYLLAAKGVVNNNNHRFVSMIMAAFTGKLLLCVIFILAYALVIRPQGKPFFIIPFFVFYIVFTSLEVVELLRLTRQANKK